MNLAAELDKIIAWQVTGQQQYRVAYEQLILQQRRSAEDEDRDGLGASPPLQQKLFPQSVNHTTRPASSVMRRSANSPTRST